MHELFPSITAQRTSLQDEQNPKGGPRAEPLWWIASTEFCKV